MVGHVAAPSVVANWQFLFRGPLLRVTAAVVAAIGGPAVASRLVIISPSSRMVGRAAEYHVGPPVLTLALGFLLLFELAFDVGREKSVPVTVGTCVHQRFVVYVLPALCR